MTGLDDPARLAALRAASLLDTAPEETFDRFVRLAARLLRVPVALFTLVDDKRQFFKSALGLGEPLATRRETPLAYSFCKHVVAARAPFVVTDARDDPRVRDNPAVSALGVVAYLGVPLTTPGGHVLGALCVIDMAPRAWSGEDVGLLGELAAAVSGEIELRRERDALLATVRRSLAELDALFTNAPVGLVLFDRDVRLLRINHTLAELLGQPPEATVGKRISEVLPGLETDIESVFRGVIEQDAPLLDQEVVSEAPAQPGRKRTWQASYFPVRTGPGEVIGMGGVLIETTAWRTLEAEKRQSMLLLQDVLQNAPAMISVIDRAGIYRMINSANAAVYGRAPEEIVGLPLRAFVPPAVADEVLALDESVYRSGAPLELDQELLRDGVRRRFHVVKFPLGGDHGMPGSVASIVTDVTEEHVARERLATLSRAGVALAGHLDVKEAFARVAQLLVPGLADWCSLFVPGDDGHELLSLRHTEASLEPLVRSLGSEVRAPVEPRSGYQTVLRTGRSELMVEAPPGESALAGDVSDEQRAVLYLLDCVSAVFAPVPVDGRTYGVLGLFTTRFSGRNYTEDDRAFAEQLASRMGITVENSQLLGQREHALESVMVVNEQLEDRVATRTAELSKKNVEVEEARKEAERADRTKGQFLARMSHEIRTPLNGVLGLARLLLETKLDDDQREMVQTIRTSGDSLLGILNEILDFSKLEAGRVALEVQPFDLRGCVKDVADLFAPVASEASVTLSTSTDEDVPRWVRGDATRLRQVLNNLVGNAVKFTGSGGSVIVHVRRDGAEADGRALVCFEVRDTGIGFDEAQGARLFTPFTQASESTSRLYGGTGLGLAIAWQLVELMEGGIDVASEPGVGTVFTVRVPLAVESTAERPSAPPSAGAPVDRTLGTRHPLRVLVAEDNVINQRVAVRLLALLGYQADLAADGEEAVEAVRARSYDLVFMDVHMPRVDGFEATRRIREREAGGAGAGRRVRIVAMTASSFQDDRTRSFEAGMDDFVSKPVRVEELEASLRRTIGARGE